MRALVAEVAHACEDHGDAVLVGSGKHLFVAHGAAGKEAFGCSLRVFIKRMQLSRYG